MTRPSQKYFQVISAIPEITFVETGLYKGGGVDAALKAGFTKIVSIEPVLDFIQACSVKFEKHISSERMHFYHGGSEVQLAIALKDISTPVCYWLDGHFQGVKEGVELNCPLKEEVEAIISKKNKESDVILIDDLRLVRNVKNWKGHETDVFNVIGRLIEAFPRHVALYLNGHVENDVLAIVPAFLAQQFIEIRSAEVHVQLLALPRS